MKFNSKNIAITGISVALVAVCTMVISIPVPATTGFINIGDTMIFVVASLFNPLVGMIAGGLGSAMADVLLGYTHWAPFTLVIKGLEGLCCGLLINLFRNKIKSKKIQGFMSIFAYIIAALVMVVGYFFGGWILKGSWQVALTSVPENLIQGGSSVIIAYIVVFATKLVKNKVQI